MKGFDMTDFTHIFFCVWRSYRMYKQTMNFMRGIGTGLIAGVTIATVGTQMMKNNRGLRRRANRTLRTVGDLMDGMQGMFK